MNVTIPLELDIDTCPKEFPQATTTYFKSIQERIKKIMDSGQLGIFSAQWWDHPDYNLLPPEVHLMAVSHYLHLLDRQRELVTSHLVFGGKNPHPHYVVGGMPCSISMNDMNAPVNTERLAVVDASINLAIALTSFFYVPDVMAISQLYSQQGYVDGGGVAKERVLGFGDYPEDRYSGVSNGDFHKNLLLHSDGIVENFVQGVDKAVFYPFEANDLADPEVLTESVEHSWYSYPEKDKDLHPWQGVTKPKFTPPKEGSKTDWKYLDENEKYSWIKTPKWRGKAAEVGPLSRYIIVYTKVKKGIIASPTWVEKLMVEQIDSVSGMLSLPPQQWMLSTLGRTAVRALEAQVMAYLSKYYFKKLVNNIKAGDTSVFNMEKWEPETWPKETKGVGLHEAPRGALSHWVIIKDRKIENYQAIVPSTWNACPRDSRSGYGPYEASMMDTKVKIANKPLEILKVIHSFDPCLACATHLYDDAGRQVAVIHSDPYIRM